VYAESNIALDCPYCSEPIYETLAWFKKSYSTCPHCDQGLVADQFSVIINNLEQAMDESIEEMINGKPQGGCCGAKSSCGDGGGCH
jgi:transcription initiation factor IIE alpha subunit